MSRDVVEMIFDSRGLRGLKEAAKKEVIRAGAIATRDTTKELEKAYEAAGKKAGLGRLALAWKSKVLTAKGRELIPVGIVFPAGGERTRQALRAHGYGAHIKAHGGGLLWWPTGYNKALGRRNEDAAPRVSLDLMAEIEGAFVVTAKSNSRIKLWCLPVAEAQKRNINTGRVSRLAFAAGRANLQVGTSRKKGVGFRSKALLDQGFVPMFIGARSTDIAQSFPLRETAQPFPARLARSFELNLSFGKLSGD